MTLVIAWERGTRSGSELCIASDSRLSGGTSVDFCQKIFRLSRNDGAIAFAGTTAIAYPFILQILSVVNHDPRMRDRSIDFAKVPKIVLGLLNKFIFAHEVADRMDFLNDLEGTSFIIGGWSAALGVFLFYRIRYNKNSKQYDIIRSSRSTRFKLQGAKMILVGDYAGYAIKQIEEEFSSKLQGEQKKIGLRAIKSPTQNASQCRVYVA